MQKGSFTIEAVIIIPFVLVMLFQVLRIGINFYEQSMEAEISEDVKNWDSVSAFYKISVLKEQGEALENE